MKLYTAAVSLTIFVLYVIGFLTLKAQPNEALHTPSGVTVTEQERSALENCELSLEKGDLEDAEAWGRLAVAEQGDLPEAHLAYAKVLREKMRGGGMAAMMNVRAYKELLEEALRLDPQHVPTLVEKIGFLCSAPRIAGGNSKKAMALATSLIALDEAKGMSMQAFVLGKTDRRDQQIELLKVLTDRFPNQPEHRFQLGRALSAAGRNGEAAKTHELLLEEEGTDPINLFYAGANYAKAGERLPRALVLLQAFLELPDAELSLTEKSRVLYYQALAYQGLNQGEEMRLVLEEALLLDPEFEEAKKLAEQN